VDGDLGDEAMSSWEDEDDETPKLSLGDVNVTGWSLGRASLKPGESEADKDSESSPSFIILRFESSLLDVLDLRAEVFGDAVRFSSSFLSFLSFLSLRARPNMLELVQYMLLLM
jgi:hypothetical protein